MDKITNAGNPGRLARISTLAKALPSNLVVAAVTFSATGAGTAAGAVFPVAADGALKNGEVYETVLAPERDLSRGAPGLPRLTIEPFEDGSSVGNVQISAKCQTGELGVCASTSFASQLEDVSAQVGLLATLTFDLTAFSPSDTLTVSFSNKISGSPQNFTPGNGFTGETASANHAFALYQEIGLLREQSVFPSTDYVVNLPFLIPAAGLASSTKPIVTTFNGPTRGDFTETGPNKFDGVFDLQGGALYERVLETSLSLFGRGSFFRTATTSITGLVPFALVSGTFLTGDPSPDEAPVPLPLSLPMLATAVTFPGVVRRGIVSRAIDAVMGTRWQKLRLEIPG